MVRIPVSYFFTRLEWVSRYVSLNITPERTMPGFAKLSVGYRMTQIFPAPAIIARLGRGCEDGTRILKVWCQ
jgi:hypothetical protein